MTRERNAAASSLPANGRNAKGTHPRCAHASECEVGLQQQDLKAMVERLRDDSVTQEQFARSTGALTEALERASVALERMSNRLSEVSHAQIVATQREALTSRLLTAMVRHFVRVSGEDSGKALADEFAAIQASATRELGGSDGA